MSRRAGVPALISASMVGLAACAGVLGLHDRAPAPQFPHRAHLFEGVGCFRCHPGLASGGPALRLPSAESCLECHAPPHRSGDCLACHADPSTRPRLEASRRHLRFDHALHLPEVNMSCGRCHLGVPDDRAEPPSMTTCLSCHGHQDAYDVRACGQCHTDLPAEAVKPASHAVHGPDFALRHGAFAGSQRDYCATCHGERDCLQCHGVSVAALPSRLDLARPDRRAAGLHRAGFRARHAEEARAAPGTCTTCHTPATCADCHARTGVGATGALSRGPHPPDWVGLGPAQNRHGRAARLDPVGCAACHDGTGEQLCVSCHAVGGVGGNIHPPGWRSQKRITERPCRLCHLAAGP